MRTIAFHLPQFHPIPENDAWWGPGFTEWTNVAKARPLFRGHQQPLRPADLGYYDLRVAETRAAQGALAKQYGVNAFCYWHYWFAGQRLLERPVEEMIASGSPDQPFCLGWANQTWTGIWHGAPGRILMEQTYPGAEDDQRHFDALLPAFADPRYFRVDGRPLFYVFRPEQIPDVQAWTERWQRMAQEAGLGGLYLVAEISDLLGRGPTFAGVKQAGFDSAVYVRLPARTDRASILRMRARRKLRRGPETYPHSTALPAPPASLDGEPLHPCVYPNWDNTPRSGRGGVVVRGTSPARFTDHVQQAVLRSREQWGSPDERLLFVKSWNEWAEGNHLEPDAVHGHAWLEALSRGTAG